MLSEDRLIPFAGSTLPPGKKWLVFAPHADDETIGMGGTLLLAKQQLIDVSLVVMTDGSLGIAESDRQQTARIRKVEARRVADALGISQLDFLDLPDRGISPSNLLINRVAALVEKLKPDCVFVPAPLELHPDHRMTTFLVWKVLPSVAVNCEFFGYEISRQGPVTDLIDISTVMVEKYRTLQLYQSQVTQNNYLEISRALDVSRTYTLPDSCHAAEGFFMIDLQSRASPLEQALAHLQRYRVEAD